jgi:8-oxo-dGTP diphosphatase
LNDLHLYPKPSVTIDSVVFGYDGESLLLLLINRREEPYKNCWTLPGGFMYMEETAEACAERVLKEKTGLREVFLEQLYSFTATDRDPRGRVIAIAYYALVNPQKYQLVAGQKANEIKWFKVNDLPAMGFDHAAVVAKALSRLKAKVTYQPIGFELLAEKFTLTELQFLYETVLQKTIDKRNFRKRIQESGVVRATGEKRKGLKNRAPELFVFDPKKYEEIVLAGFEFKI